MNLFFFPRSLRVSVALNKSQIACVALGSCALLPMDPAWSAGLKMAYGIDPGALASVQRVQPDPAVVTFVRAYELALEKDLSFAAALASYRAMQEKVPQAKAALRPNVALSAGLTASTSAPSSNSRLEETLVQQSGTNTASQTTGETTETSKIKTAEEEARSTTRSTTTSQTTSETDSEEQRSQSTVSGNRQDLSRNIRGLSAESAINFTWPLYRPSLHRQLEQSALVEEQARLQLNAARQDVALRVARAYFDVLLARENLAALAVQKTAIEQQLAVAENSFQEGVSTIADVREAQAKKDTVTAQEVALRNAIKVRNSALQALIGVRAEAVQQLRVDDLLGQYTLSGAVDHWIALAQDQAFEVQIETLGLRIAQKELDKQTAAYKPTLDVVANLGASRSREVGRTQSNTSQTDQSAASTSGTSSVSSNVASESSGTSNTGGTPSSASSNSRAQTATQSTIQTDSQTTLDISSSRPASHSRSYNKQWDAYVGIRLNIPLLDGGLTNSRVRESVALQEKNALDLQRVRAEAALAAESAYLEAAGFLAEAQALKAAEISGQVALESNQMGYEVGLRINSDVLNAQQLLFTTRRDLMRAQVDALVATLRLKASVGGFGGG